MPKKNVDLALFCQHDLSQNNSLDFSHYIEGFEPSYGVARQDGKIEQIYVEGGESVPERDEIRFISQFPIAEKGMHTQMTNG